MGRIENHDGKAWRARAEVCRAIADTFDNPQTRAKMYAVAADYELLAERAEQYEASAARSDAAGPAARQGPESRP